MAPDGPVRGRGTAGRCLAPARRSGDEVELIDLDPAWRAFGAGMTLNGPTLRAFTTVVMLDEVAIQGFPSEQSAVCDVNDAMKFTSHGARAFGPDIPNSGSILRPRLHAILSAKVRGPV